MAFFRQLLIEKDHSWCIVNPRNLFESLRLGWMLWKYPDRVGVLAGIKNEVLLDPTKYMQMENALPILSEEEVNPAGAVESILMGCIEKYGVRLFVEMLKHISIHKGIITGHNLDQLLKWFEGIQKLEEVCQYHSLKWGKSS